MIHFQAAVRTAVLCIYCTCGALGTGISWERRLCAQEDQSLAVLMALQEQLQKTIARGEKSVVSVSRVTAKLPSQFSELRGDLDPFRNRGNQRLQPPITDPSDPNFIPSEFGAGIIIPGADNDAEPLILTNFHLVRGGLVADSAEAAEAQIFVQFAGRRGCEARIWAADPRSDLAVLRPELAAAGIRASDLQPIEIGQANDFRKGTIVLALGNPYAIGRDGSASVSWGVVSNMSRQPAPPSPWKNPSRQQSSIHQFGTLLHVDTRLNLGMSGGALLDLNGKLIGITTALAALEGYEKSAGFAIPVDQATRRVIDSLVQGFEVEYGFLGLTPATVNHRRMQLLSADFDQPSAAGVENIFGNSPADAAGLRRGDVILSVNGRTLYDEGDLIREIGLLGPEAVATLRVWRESLRREIELPVRLGKWPVDDDAEIVAARTRYPSWRGVEVDYPTGRLRYFPVATDLHRAVAVGKLTADAPPEVTEQLQVGDFISRVEGKPVETPAEFHAAVARFRGKPVRLQLVDGRTVTVPE